MECLRYYAARSHLRISCQVRCNYAISCSVKTAGNFINECGTRDVPWFDEKTRRSLLLISKLKEFLTSFLKSNSIPFFRGIISERRGGKKIGNEKEKDEVILVARVYIHLAREYDCIKECTRSVYQSGTSRAVKFRPVASSSSRFVASLCLSLSLSGGGAKRLLERRGRNEATLWLTIPSCNGQRPGGSATRRQDLFRSACVRTTRINRDLRADAP